MLCVCLSSDINAEKSQCTNKEDVLGTMDTMTRESLSLFTCSNIL